MERQFTAKDFFFASLLAVILIVVLIAMYQVDRQWNKMAEMTRALDEQAQDLRELRGFAKSLDQQLRQGVTVAGSGGSGAAADAAGVPKAFQRAYAVTQRPDYAEGDWIVQAFGTGLKTITPLVSSDAYASDVQNYVQESLLTRDPDTLDWQGLIAKSWTVSDDGLRFVFQLRNDVTFSDGKPLTAHDVAFTFAFTMDAAIAAPRARAYFDKIASVTATSDFEVVFQFKEPYFDALSLAGGMAVMPKHFYEPYLKEPNTFNESKGLLLGSGPYRLKDPSSWTPDLGMVELETNPRYWGVVKPPYKRLLWKIIQNDSARLTTYRNGQIDNYSARPVEYQKLLDDPELIAQSQRFEYMSPVAGYSYIGWNQARDGKATRFADVRVRRAMTLLTDQQRIIKDIFLGYGEPAISPFQSWSKQHDPQLQPQMFDLDKAQALLKEAGYDDRDGDGVLENAAGEPFKFELVYFQDNEDSKRMVLLLKDLFARAKVQLEPKPTEWAVMLDLIKKKDFDAITLGWTSGIETDIYQMFHSSQTVVDGDNFINYKNEKLDKLIEQARATVDDSKRMPLWQECERIMVEDQPYTFLLRRKSLVFIDKRFQNMLITKTGLNFSGLPVEHYVPKAAQRYQ